MKSAMNLLSHLKFSKRLAHILLLSTFAIYVALANAAKEDSKLDAKHSNENQSDHEEKIAVLTDAQLKTAGIELAKVSSANLHESVSFYGTVEANGEKIQRVAARFAGVVRSVNKKVGDSVRAGDVLATIESNESLKTYSLTATLNGVIAERNINVNEQTGDKTLFVVADLSSVWVDVAVFPRDVNKVHVGQAVRVTNPNNGASAEGEIITVAVIGANQTQALSARVLLKNADHQWIPGLFVNADVFIGSVSAAFAVSSDAIQEYEGKSVVFIKRKNGFEPRAIKPGRTDGQLTEVLSGLAVGETYVSKNSFIIKAELGKDGVQDE